MHAGEVIWVDFGTPIGSEPGFVRPAIVITADRVLGHHPRTVHVVPVTSNIERSLLTEVPLDRELLGRECAAQVHLTTAISVERIIDSGDESVHVGAVPLTQIRQLIVDLLDVPA